MVRFEPFSNRALPRTLEAAMERNTDPGMRHVVLGVLEFGIRR